MSIFEIGMLACFGVSWPMSIIRSAKSKSTKGKSIAFSFAILIGYACGIAHKVLYSPDFVIGLYVLNFCMVFVDILLWFRNRNIEKGQAQN